MKFLPLDFAVIWAETPPITYHPAHLATICKIAQAQNENHAPLRQHLMSLSKEAYCACQQCQKLAL